MATEEDQRKLDELFGSRGHRPARGGDGKITALPKPFAIRCEACGGSWPWLTDRDHKGNRARFYRTVYKCPGEKN